MNVKLIGFVFVISATAIVLLNAFGHTIFGVNNIQDYRKGIRIRFISALKFEFIMLPLSVFTYFRLRQYAKYILSYGGNRAKVQQEVKYLRLISLGILLWLFLAHAAYFLYFIPDSMPHPLSDLFFISTGLWYHIVIPLISFSLISIFISALSTIISITNQPIFKCLSRVSALKSYYFNENLQTGFCLTIALLLCFISFIFRDKLVVKHLCIEVRDLPNGAEGIRFALISDIHAGPTVYKEQIANVVDRLNNEIVDAVFFVGDAIDGPRESIEDRVEPLRFLSAKTFYVSGNHEYYYGNASEWFDLFEKYGFEVLNNRHAYFHGICIAGVSDYSSGNSGLPDHKFKPIEALSGCYQNSTTIVLSHNPTSASEIVFNDANLRVDLILSGHTHAGQFYTVVPIAYWILPYFYGLYKISEKSQIFVTAGTLYQGPPMKMVWMSEIWIITLRSIA